jgi:hypothetical protein
LDRGRARRAIMLDDRFKAAMGITAYVLIVLVKACELSLGGAITLADVREPAVVILCHAGAWALQHGAAHRQAWRRGSSRNTVMPRAARTARAAAGLSFSPRAADHGASIRERRATRRKRHARASRAASAELNSAEHASSSSLAAGYSAGVRERRVAPGEQQPGAAVGTVAREHDAAGRNAIVREGRAASCEQHTRAAGDSAGTSRGSSAGMRK